MPLWNLSDRFYITFKSVKFIRYKNCAKLFVLNGNKRPIRYEFHNGINHNRYNGNMVLQNIDEQLLLYRLFQIIYSDNF